MEEAFLYSLHVDTILEWFWSTEVGDFEVVCCHSCIVRRYQGLQYDYGGAIASFRQGS